MGKHTAHLPRSMRYGTTPLAVPPPPGRTCHTVEFKFAEDADWTRHEYPTFTEAVAEARSLARSDVRYLYVDDIPWTAETTDRTRTRPGDKDSHS